MLNKIISNTIEIVGFQELQKLLKFKKNITIKVGFDPTSPDLHLGHFLLFKKMRDFQDLGFIVTFLIGDFTALIGDPTGRFSQREKLTKKTVYHNCLLYKKYIKKFLDPKLTKVVFNSFWLSKLRMETFLKLCTFTTVAQMLHREDFSKKLKSNIPIHLNEFLYPILQGFDSVIMKADIEIGGIDQKFNLLVGRELQRHFFQTEQILIMLPLLEGLDGIRKMSKSYNNYISLFESTKNIFGKIMSISDELMWLYYEKICAYSLDIIALKKNEIVSGKNPKEIKLELAFLVVKKLYGLDVANVEHENFIKQFFNKCLPDKVDEQTLICDLDNSLKFGGIPLIYALKKLLITKSISESLRLLKQKAIYVDNTVLQDKNFILLKCKNYLIRVGKKFFIKLFII